MKNKLFITFLTATILVSCTMCASDVYAISHTILNEEINESHREVDYIIRKLKKSEIPIQYDIIFTDDTDPNGPGQHDYVEKGSFSDSRIENDYNPQAPLSGTIEIFEGAFEARRRANYLKDLEDVEDATDHFPYRIISENVLLRLNGNYTVEQLEQFVEIIEGEPLYDIAASDINIENYPTVTYDDILSGSYNGRLVCVNAIIDKLIIQNSKCNSFSLWYPCGETYVYEGSQSIFSHDPDAIEKILLSAQNGDIIKIVTRIYNDGSFGDSGFIKAEIIGHKDLAEVYNVFKSSCSELNYEDSLRNADNFSGNLIKISGTIFQIIDEGDYSAEYLISTDNGYIYVTWRDKKDARGSRFLTNDNVAIYGKFNGLKKYNTLAGENTVPHLSATIFELS